jgi:tetraacyldisaccharide-1-P 4'-kinase
MAEVAGNLWTIGSALHRVWRTRRRPDKAPPVLVVGSLRAGGSMKTDLVSWIAERHPEMAVLAHPVGDEERMLASRFPGRVFAHSDWLAAWELAARKGFRAGVCDGGLQDPALDDCPAVRLDHVPGPAGPADLLPFGAFRQLRPTRRAEELVLVVGSDLRASLDPRDLPPPGTEVSAACAVACPEIFFGDLDAAGLCLAERVAFPDHARFPRRLISRMERDDRIWLATEKDAARGKLPRGTRAVRRILTVREDAARSIDLLADGLPG